MRFLLIQTQTKKIFQTVISFYLKINKNFKQFFHTSYLVKKDYPGTTDEASLLLTLLGEYKD